ncbi:MAG: sigma-54-dependent Fis family transcriptional regulator [Bdellovibrionales bacterium]|nr:sigma-54-dependent Fis family transcriptional regulator [Bdellovibrionales bacterium]
MLEDTPIIALTHLSFKQKALQAISQGALHYLVKPFEFNEVVHLFDHAINYQILNKENSLLKKELISKNSFHGIIGRSSSMRKLFDLVNQIADSTANILIQGATGTGKEVIAKSIHNLSSRKSKPFVAINCSAIPEALLESELFGHVRGSFTGAVQNKKGLFEEANGGTLFLDEIGDLPQSLQAKLLRVIQERTIRPVGDTISRSIDIRIISATHRDLKSMIKTQEFRDDLFYRLAVIPLSVPTLSQRKEDIPLLANHFLNKYSILNSKKFVGFSSEALNFLMTYDWPGNVRELENTIERSVVLAKSEKVEVEDLSLDISSESGLFISNVESNLPTIAELEKKYIEFVLSKTNHQKEKAAEILGLNRKTLYRKEKEYGWDKMPQVTHEVELN